MMKSTSTIFITFFCFTFCNAQKQRFSFENHAISCKIEVSEGNDSITALFSIVNKLQESVYLPDSLAESDIDFFNKEALSVNIGCDQNASIDAPFFLREILPMDTPLNAKKEIESLTELVWTFKVQSFSFELPTLIFQITSTIQNLYKVALHISDASKWDNFQEELLKLFLIIHEFTAYKHLKSISIFHESTLKEIIDFYVNTNLLAEKSHIQSAYTKIVNDKSISPETKFFLNDLINKLNSNASFRESKKKSYSSLKIELAKHFPNIPSDQIEKLDLNKKDIHTDLIKLIHEYNNLNILNDKLMTGFSQGEVILNKLIYELKNLLPTYSANALQQFIIPLSEIIRFQVMTSKGSKTNYPALFDKDAKENPLQNVLVNHFQHSHYAESFKAEVVETADGGRIDIEFKDHGLVFPIEVKKVEKKPSWHSISEDFLSQAQTYTYPNNQLGFLVVFDKSDKSKERNSPINHIGDLFKIQQLICYYDIASNCPCYVVSIVPANKIVPSQRTKYS